MLQYVYVDKDSHLRHDVVTCMSHSRRGFRLDIGFIDYINKQLVITLNYSAIADIHTLKSPEHTLSLIVFTSSCLVTASYNTYSSASGLKSSLNGGSLPTEHSCNSN
jgi:hypothetical protein